MAARDDDERGDDCGPGSGRMVERSSLTPLPLVPPPAMFYPFLVLFLVSYCILTHIVKTWYYKTFGYK